MLEKFQATREKVVLLSDRVLSNAEEQLGGLYNTVVLEEDKRICNPESKAIKPRVQVLLKKSNVLLVTLLGRIYEELRSKNFNKENLLKLFAAVKEKIQSIASIEDVQIVTEMAYEYLFTTVFKPSVSLLQKGRGLVLELPQSLTPEQFKALVEAVKEKSIGLKDASFVLYNDKVKVFLNKESLRNSAVKALESGQQKIQELKKLNVQKEGLELVNKGKENSLALYNSLKEKLAENKKHFSKTFHEKKMGRKLKEKCEEMEQVKQDIKMQERQEKILNDISEMKHEEIKEKLVENDFMDDE